MQRNYALDSDNQIELPFSDANGKIIPACFGIKFSFPIKLHALIDDAANDGRDYIVSWIQGGRAFQIHKPKEFTNLLLPKYFDQIKYRSFQRQLHLYGFQLLKKGGRGKATPMRGAYAHKLFIRGEPDLCLQMTRSNKGCKVGMKPNRASSCLQNLLKLEKNLFFDESVVSQLVGKKSDHSPKQRGGTLVEERHVLGLKQRFDEMLGCLSRNHRQYEMWDDTFSSLVIEDDLRDGDLTLFEGRRFHFVET